MEAPKLHSMSVSRGRDEVEVDDPEEDPSVREIIAGITQDARDFVSLELETLKLDLRRELADAKSAAVAGVVGASVLYLGALILLMALAYGLAAATDLPLWAGYGIVGLLVVGVGGGFLMRAKAKGDQVDLPPPAIEEAKEDIRWIRESTSG